MKRPRIRPALKIAACAIAGAVTTVLVAWACALWVYRGVEGSSSEGELRWSVPVPHDWPPAPQGRATFRLIGRKFVSESVFHDYSASIDMHAVEVHWAGWPALALQSHQTVWLKGHSLATPGTTSKSSNGITIPYWWANQGGDDGVLPTRPLWPGFAINTIFYGTLVFLLWTAPGMIRRRVRRRSGRCPACGYDLRGTPNLPCPECGA